MRTLVKTIKFYNDGTYEEILSNAMECENNTDVDVKLQQLFSSQTTSSKIKYNVAMCILCKEFYQACDFEYIQRSFQYLKNFMNVTAQVIKNKTHTELKLKSEKYKEIIIKYVEQNDDEMKRILLENVKKCSADADRRLIEQYL